MISTDPPAATAIIVTAMVATTGGEVTVRVNALSAYSGHCHGRPKKPVDWVGCSVGVFVGVGDGSGVADGDVVGVGVGVGVSDGVSVGVSDGVGVGISVGSTGGGG